MISAVWIEEAFLRVQDAFLDDHALMLNAAQASGRFRLPAADCEAILASLLRRGVLAKTPEGEYVRFLPRFALDVPLLGCGIDDPRIRRIKA